MSHFWRFARRMLRRKILFAASIAMALLSALSLGGGLLALAPLLEQILMSRDGQTLRTRAAEFSESIPLTIPQSWINLIPEEPLPAAALLLGGLVLLTIFGAMMNFLHAYFALTITTDTVADIRRDLFRHVVHLPLRTLSRGVSDTTSRIITDCQLLMRGFESLMSRALAQLTKSAAGFVAALVLSWQLTLVASLVAPFLYVVIRKLGKRVRRASRGAMRAQADLLSSTTEALQGLRVVKVHNAERYEVGRFTRHNRRFVREQFRARVARALASPLNETIAVVILAGLALFSARAIIEGAIDAPRFVATLGALAIAASALKPLTKIIQEIQASEAAAQRLAELFDESPEPLPAFIPGRRRLPRLSPHRESIRFEDVRLTYPAAETPAVDGVNLAIRAGETVAFVGPNGSGKTSLLSLIPRLYDPDRGCVRIDGADIREVDLRSLRRQIGVVTQEVVLFRGTIADNIAYGVAGAARERVIDAARRAGAHEFIQDKPGGYDTIVGDQGLTLSGGQRQRLAIARAILRDPRILLLDEATSMIDADSERRIGEALSAFSEGRTTLVVAHRLSTVRSADRIAVLEAGRLVDVGSHDELLTRCRIYRLLAQTQLAPHEA